VVLCDVRERRSGKQLLTTLIGQVIKMHNTKRQEEDVSVS
jgi:hypothetical protein